MVTLRDFPVQTLSFGLMKLPAFRTWTPPTVLTPLMPRHLVLTMVTATFRFPNLVLRNPLLPSTLTRWRVGLQQPLSPSGSPVRELCPLLVVGPDGVIYIPLAVCIKGSVVTLFTMVSLPYDMAMKPLYPFTVITPIFPL